MFSVNNLILPETVNDPPSNNSNSPDPLRMLMLNFTAPKNNLNKVNSIK